MVKAAIADRALSLAVARHKAIFFAEKDSDGAAIDYEAAVTGALQIVPHDDALESLSLDYAQMVEDGLLSMMPNHSMSFWITAANCRNEQIE
jgi:hypothetical protein